jgi:hypothetical protein
MPIDIAEKVLYVAGMYLAAGVMFALLFFAIGLRRVDATAANGLLGFKVLILPGVIVLWPLLLALWLAASANGDRI